MKHPKSAKPTCNYAYFATGRRQSCKKPTKLLSQPYRSSPSPPYVTSTLIKKDCSEFWMFEQ